VEEVERQEILARQLAMTPATWGVMRTRGVSEATPLKVDLFFYSPNEDRAQALASHLRDTLGNAECDVQSGTSNGTFSVQAVVPERTYTEQALLELVTNMCNVGFEHDSEFDGWGAPIPQPVAPKKPWWRFW
jgi:hypothetical protein